jgi:hypothetical protein
MLSNTRYKPIQEQYGWYDKYNFFQVYKQHDPLNCKVKFIQSKEHYHHQLIRIFTEQFLVKLLKRTMIT